MLKPEHENMELGHLSAAHTAVFIAGERMSHWWLPDGKELSNPAESHKRFSEKMSRQQKCKVSQGDTLDIGLEVWKPAREHHWTSLSYSGNQRGVTMQIVNQVKWLLPTRGKVGQRKWKGWSPVQTLFWPWSDFDEAVNYRTIIGPWAWSHSPLEPWTTEETWIETKAILWTTLSIQIGNKLESLWAHSETHSIRLKQGTFFSSLLKEKQEAISQTCTGLCEWNCSRRPRLSTQSLHSQSFVKLDTHMGEKKASWRTQSRKLSFLESGNRWVTHFKLMKLSSRSSQECVLPRNMLQTGAQHRLSNNP